MFPDGRRVVFATSYERRSIRPDPKGGYRSEDYYIPLGVVKVLDVETGECLATMEGHLDTVRCSVRVL